MLNSPPSGSEADNNLTPNRRRSIQVPVSPQDRVHRRLPSLFSGTVLGSSADTEDASSDDDDGSSEDMERRENFLGRVHSYSKLMHAHTKLQLASPSTGTLPSYTRTMRAFTLNQLHGHNVQQEAKSEAPSPQLGVDGRQLFLPFKICSELSKLGLDDVPRNPSNTPEIGSKDTQRVDVRMQKRRSVTEPIPRDFAASVKARDFGAN